MLESMQLQATHTTKHNLHNLSEIMKLVKTYSRPWTSLFVCDLYLFSFG